MPLLPPFWQSLRTKYKRWNDEKKLHAENRNLFPTKGIVLIRAVLNSLYAKKVDGNLQPQGLQRYFHFKLCYKLFVSLIN